MKTKSWFNLLIISVVLSVFAVNCKPVDDTPEITAPFVTTDTIFETTQTSAILGGKITSDGGSAVTERGICWSLKSDPTTKDDTLLFGKGNANFGGTITGLLNNTKYFVRAFATNGIGTSYGNQMTFTTGLVADVDGNIYHYITIGTQTWMLENLKTTRFRNSDKIALVSGNTEWAALSTPAFAYPNNDQANLTLHGRLYNWYAAHDTRSVCPKGWRLPTDADYNVLGDFLLGNATAGAKLKQAGLTNWDSPNQGADNSSGFTALGSGMRDMDGTFKDFKASAYFWSATPKDATTGIAWYVTKDLVSFLNKAYDKKIGFTIRCIKN